MWLTFVHVQHLPFSESTFKLNKLLMNKKSVYLSCANEVVFRWKYLCSNSLWWGSHFKYALTVVFISSSVVVVIIIVIIVRLADGGARFLGPWWLLHAGRRPVKLLHPAASTEPLSDGRVRPLDCEDLTILKVQSM